MANKGGKCPVRKLFSELLILQRIALLREKLHSKKIFSGLGTERKPSLDKESCLMQHSKGDYGYLLYRFIGISDQFWGFFHRALCILHYAFSRTFNYSSFVPTKMQEVLGDDFLINITKAIVRVKARYTTGSFQDSTTHQLMVSAQEFLWYIWCAFVVQRQEAVLFEIQGFTYVTPQAAVRNNLRSTQEAPLSLHQLRPLCVCRSGDAKKLPTVCYSLTKAFQNFQFPKNKREQR